AAGARLPGGLRVDRRLHRVSVSAEDRPADVRGQLLVREPAGGARPGRGVPRRDGGAAGGRSAPAHPLGCGAARPEIGDRGPGGGRLRGVKNFRLVPTLFTGGPGWPDESPSHISSMAWPWAGSSNWSFIWLRAAASAGSTRRSSRSATT